MAASSLCNLSATLPEHLHEKILTFLPTVDLLRLRAVCKQWLLVISSSPLLLRSRAPWLLLHSKTTHSFACDVEAREWYKLPPCILPRGHVLHGCVQGLLVAESDEDTCSIGDPWSGSWTHVKVAHPFIARLCGFQFDEERNCHSLLASLWSNINSSFQEVTHVFRSSDSCTSQPSATLRYNPECFMVECNGALYSWISPRGLLIYDQGKDRCLYEDGSAWLKENNSTLLNCGGTLVKVFVRTLEDDLYWRYNKETHVIIQQWHTSGSIQEPLQWEEVGIMPPNLLAELFQGRSKIDIEFSSAGTSKVCFRARMGITILTFDIRKRTWEWLPKCPDLPKHKPKSEYHHFRAFGLQVWPRYFPQIRTRGLDHHDSNVNK